MKKIVKEHCGKDMYQLFISEDVKIYLCVECGTVFKKLFNAERWIVPKINKIIEEVIG